jgi:hypothetical protein
MEGTRFFDHEPCLVGEEGVIGDAFELQQEQGRILAREIEVFDIIETLEDVLTIEAQVIWIVLLYALKVNQRYWVHFYRRSAVWAFFLL